MTTWPEVTLAEVSAKPQYGAISSAEDQAVGPKFVRQTDIISGRVDWATVPYAALTPADTLKYSLREGDLLISRLGAGVGNAARMDATEGAVFAGYLVRFRVRPEVADSRFVGYALQSHQWRSHVQAVRSGGAQPTLNAKQMGIFRFALPPLGEQERIAGVLGAFDDLIETNMSTVRALESLGRTVVSALDAQESTLRVATLSEACSVIESGRRPKGGVKGIDSGVPSLGAESVNGLTEFNFSKTKYVPEEFAASMKRGVLTDLDVLVYKDGGKPGEFFPDVSIVGNGYPFDNMVINEHVFRVRAAEPLSQGYLYFWLNTGEMMRRMKEIGSRTAAIPGMNSTNFGQLPIPIPSTDWGMTNLRALDQVVEGALSLLAECRDLTRRRDELLPLLMSGRVRVRDLEAVA